MTILIHFNDKNDIPQTYTISGTSQDLNNELQKFKKYNNLNDNQFTIELISI